MSERKVVYLDDAIEAIRKLPNAGIHWYVSAEAVFDALLKLPSAQSEQRWIPCTERLPEDGRCLVTRFDFVTNTCFLDILWYEKGVWWNRLYTGDFAVIAWMPLPEPYKAESEE